jgi:hypothetical protein
VLDNSKLEPPAPLSPKQQLACSYTTFPADGLTRQVRVQTLDGDVDLFLPSFLTALILNSLLIRTRSALIKPMLNGYATAWVVRITAQSLLNVYLCQGRSDPT